MSSARYLHRVLIALFLAGAVTEFFLAGVGVFGAGSFDAHRGIGNLLLAISLLALASAAIARKFVVHTAVLFVLMVIQYTLVNAGEDASPWIAALHPLNGLFIVAASGSLARRAFADVSWPRSRTAPAVTPARDAS